MISKEPLNKIWDFIETHYNEKDDYPKNLYDILEDVEQDLDRLEQMDEVNGYLQNKIQSLQSENLTLKKFIKEKTNIEKELKQTKLNFKNSQIHSKNCYKKLKEKYNFISNSNEWLIEENVSLNNEVDCLHNEIEKFKKVIEIFKIKCINERILQASKDVHQYNHWISNLRNYPELTQEVYDLLRSI